MVQTVLEKGYATVSQQELDEALARTGALERGRARADEYAENAFGQSYAIRPARLTERTAYVRCAFRRYIINRDR